MKSTQSWTAYALAMTDPEGLALLCREPGCLLQRYNQCQKEEMRCAHELECECACVAWHVRVLDESLAIRKTMKV